MDEKNSLGKYLLSATVGAALGFSAGYQASPKTDASWLGAQETVKEGKIEYTVNCNDNKLLVAISDQLKQLRLAQILSERTEHSAQILKLLRKQQRLDDDLIYVRDVRDQPPTPPVPTPPVPGNLQGPAGFMTMPRSHGYCDNVPPAQTLRDMVRSQQQ